MDQQVPHQRAITRQRVQVIVLQKAAQALDPVLTLTGKWQPQRQRCQMTIGAERQSLRETRQVGLLRLAGTDANRRQGLHKL